MTASGEAHQITTHCTIYGIKLSQCSELTGIFINEINGVRVRDSRDTNDSNCDMRDNNMIEIHDHLHLPKV